MDFLNAILRPYLNILNIQNIQGNSFNGIAILFTAISFYQAYRGVSLALSIRQNWQELRQAPLTNHKKRIAENASFFVAVPPGVLLHEIGHAIFVWFYGGRVVEFGFFFYWGYVLPSQRFDQVSEFVIASAGTWMNLLYALLLWAVLVRKKSTVIRYFGLRAIRFQIFFALIYYPIFTIALPIGDWRTIYDFSLTPILSGITAVFHVVLLLAHWWLNNNGYYDMVGFETVAQQEAYEKQLLLAQQQPDNLVLQDEVVSYMARGGAVKPAQRRILDLLKKNPDWADGHLTYAVTLVGDKSNFSRTAVRELEKALALGLSDNRQKAIAHNLLGKHYVNTERYDRGKQHLTEALEFAQTPPNTQTLLQLQAYYWRGEAARRQGKLTAAEADFRQALILAQAQKQTGFIEHISKLLTAMKGRPEKNEPA